MSKSKEFTKKHYLKTFLAVEYADGTEEVYSQEIWGGEGIPIVGYGRREWDKDGKIIGSTILCPGCAPPDSKKLAEAQTSTNINECDYIILFDEPGQRSYFSVPYQCDLCGDKF